MSNYNRSKVTVAPAGDPVTLTEAKNHLNLEASNTEFDALITGYIKAATDIVERYTGRKLIDQEITMFLDSFPASSLDRVWWNGVVQGPSRNIFGKDDNIELPWPPVASVTEVTTFDDGNNESVYAASNYFLDNADNDMYARVVLNLGALLPTNLRNRNALKVRYQAGYGAASAVPESIKTGIKMVVAYMFMNRGDCNDCSCVAHAGADSLLAPFVIHTLG
jgi:hypothetical protein